MLGCAAADDAELCVVPLLRFLGRSGDPGGAPEPPGGTSDPTIRSAASAGEVFAGMRRRGVVLDRGF